LSSEILSKFSKFLMTAEPARIAFKADSIVQMVLWEKEKKKGEEPTFEERGTSYKLWFSSDKFALALDLKAMKVTLKTYHDNKVVSKELADLKDKLNELKEFLDNQLRR